ncbi:MAG: ABC transporter permease [Alphaproteobacteria bacterium]
MILRTLGIRLGQSAAVLLVMSFAIYGLIGLMPGDPVDLMIGANPRITPEDVERLRRVYGLDQPLLGRYLAWLGDAMSGEFGYSRLSALPVGETLLPPLGRTLILLSASLALALTIALPLGVLAALRPRSRLDYAVNLLAFAGISMPVFWLGLMLVALFAVGLGWLPAGGVRDIGDEGLVDRLRHLVLPVVTLAAAGVGQHTRYMRSAMIEVLRQDFIRTAAAKGASRLRIVVHHALRNAMIPVVTVLALEFGSLFSGALITETVFAYPGMGKLIYDAVMGNDYNLALAALLLATAVTLLGNALADAAYLWLDPRIRRR